MSLYLVSCDLKHHQEFGDYDYFRLELKKFRAEKLLQTTWALSSSLNSEAIRDSLMKFMHKDDRIVVAEISVTNWAVWKSLFEIT